jgi:hypothetical protein
MNWKQRLIWTTAATLVLCLALALAVTVHMVCQGVDILTAPPEARAGWSTGDASGQ